MFPDDMPTISFRTRALDMAALRGVAFGEVAHPLTPGLRSWGYEAVRDGDAFAVTIGFVPVS